MSLLSVFEPLAEQAMEALPGDIAALLKALPAPVAGAATTVGTNAGTGVQGAVVHNLAAAMPVITTAEFDAMTAQIGDAVAEAATAWQAANPGASVKSYIVSAAGWSAIVTLLEAGFKANGLDSSMIPCNTLKQMISSGIEMFLADVGTKAISVSVSPAAA